MSSRRSKTPSIVDVLEDPAEAEGGRGNVALKGGADPRSGSGGGLLVRCRLRVLVATGGFTLSTAILEAANNEGAPALSAASRIRFLGPAGHFKYEAADAGFVKLFRLFRASKPLASLALAAHGLIFRLGAPSCESKRSLCKDPVEADLRPATVLL